VRILSCRVHPEAPSVVGIRISVVGTCGSGKTTTAQALTRCLELPHVELDSHAWGPGWSAVPDEIFPAAVAQEAASDRWIIDGNYGKCRDLVWARADTIVWLDYGFARVFWQLARRTFRRALRREVLWHGNRERLAAAFLSRNSILWWAIKTHARRKREVSKLLTRSDYRRLRVVRLHSPRATRRWVAAARFD